MVEELSTMYVLLLDGYIIVLLNCLVILICLFFRNFNLAHDKFSRYIKEINYLLATIYLHLHINLSLSFTCF
jgi:hypothetical protein